MSDDTIPNPVPAWVEARSGPVHAGPDSRHAPPHGRRPSGARRPPERHFPGFDAPSLEDLPQDEDDFAHDEVQLDPLPPLSDTPPPPPAPPRPVEEIVQEAIDQALARAAAGELTVDHLLAERERLIALRPSVDDQMRELKQLKPDYWRERRAWLLVVRSLLHNRLHIINRQIGALNRLNAPPVTDAAVSPAPAADPAGEAPAPADTPAEPAAE